MADATGAVVVPGKVLTALSVTSSEKEYAFTTVHYAHEVELVCDQDWQYSDVTGGVFSPVKANQPVVFRIPAAGKSIFIKRVSADGTLTPTVLGIP